MQKTYRVTWTDHGQPRKIDVHTLRAARLLTDNLLVDHNFQNVELQTRVKTFNTVVINFANGPVKL